MTFEDNHTTRAIYDLLDTLNEQPESERPLMLLLADIASRTDVDHLLAGPGGKRRKSEALHALGHLHALHCSYFSEDEALEEQERARKRRLEQQPNGRRFLEKMEEIKNRFSCDLHKADAQKRGYRFEEILFDLFLLCDLAPNKRFRRGKGGEEIDGGFSLGEQQFIMEAKWTKNEPNLEKLRDFHEKVKAGLGNTLGLFISVNGFRNTVLSRYLQGGTPLIVCMDGDDLRAVFDNRIGLRDLLGRKKELASRKRKIFVRADDILKGKE